jgi:hypothetical protein
MLPLLGRLYITSGLPAIRKLAGRSISLKVLILHVPRMLNSEADAGLLRQNLQSAGN